MRYHIASLVAVFLALGIGILIGSSLQGEKVIVEQQQKLIDRLGADFEGLRAEKKKLEAEVAFLQGQIRMWEQFGRAARPALLQNRLYGKQIALVRTAEGADSRLVEELRQALEEAGAEVRSVTTILRYPEETDEELLSALKEAFGQDRPWPELSRSLFQALAAHIAQGSPLANAHRLAGAELVRFSGDYKTPVDAVIVLGGAQRETDSWQKVDLPLIDALRSTGIPVAGVESSQVAYSFMPFYRQKRILTVDDADLVPGQVALIYGLAAGKRSSFGIKEGARQLLPALLEGTLP
ncbi:MAG: copper transporter [Bacillota bacterium]|nr:copper transporter [Bacillota bacterium]